MIKKTSTDQQIVDLMITRRVNTIQSELSARINNLFGLRARQSFRANSGAFGELQQGVSVGFCKHYTQRS